MSIFKDVKKPKYKAIDYVRKSKMTPGMVYVALNIMRDERPKAKKNARRLFWSLK